MCTVRSSSHLPGGCLPQCMLGSPPGCGAGDPPPHARPLNFPLGCGPGDLQGMLGYPWIPARHAGIPPAMHARIPPPPVWTEWLADRCKNITFANSFAGGNYVLTSQKWVLFLQGVQGLVFVVWFLWRSNSGGGAPGTCPVVQILSFPCSLW